MYNTVYVECDYFHYDSKKKKKNWMLLHFNMCMLWLNAEQHQTLLIWMNAKFHLNDDLMHEERMPISDIDQTSACNISCNQTTFFFSLAMRYANLLLSWVKINKYSFFFLSLHVTQFGLFFRENASSDKTHILISHFFFVYINA